MLLFICGDKKIELLKNHSHSGKALINTLMLHMCGIHTHTHICKCEWEHLNMKINISPLAFPHAVAELSQSSAEVRGSGWLTLVLLPRLWLLPVPTVGSVQRSCVWHPPGCSGISELPKTKLHKAWHRSGVSVCWGILVPLQLFLYLDLSRQSSHDSCNLSGS